MAELIFKPGDVDTTPSFDAMPPGRYEFEVESMEIKPSAAGHDYVKAVFSVRSESQNGRKIFENFNLFHPSDQVRAIGNVQFASLCKACGIFEKITDTDDLIGQTFEAETKVAAAKDGYDAQAKIKKYIFDEEKTKPEYQKNDISFEDDETPF